MREKIEAMKQEREMHIIHIEKCEKQIEWLTESNKIHVHKNQEINEKYQQSLASNFKSVRNSQDLEPIFKPLHAKTMSLVEVMKQYNTGGHNAS